MLVATRPASSRWIGILIGSLAVLLLAAASRAGDPPPRALEGTGGGALVLSPAFGGALDAVLEVEGAPYLVLRAALYDVELNTEDELPVSARVQGVLVDPVTLEPRATLSGELALDAQGNGHWSAVMHPLDGPDPWLVDIGAVEGQIQGGKGDAQGPLPAVIPARTAFVWSLVERQ
jgi:hypothetical protein